jgi:hypothetical protein
MGSLYSPDDEVPSYNHSGCDRHIHIPIPDIHLFSFPHRIAITISGLSFVTCRRLQVLFTACLMRFIINSLSYAFSGTGNQSRYAGKIGFLSKFKVILTVVFSTKY